MSRIAIVHGNAVDTVTTADSVAAITQRFPLPDGWEYVDGTGLNPGDVRDGLGLPFHAPTVSPPAGLPDVITPEQLRRCFSDDEFQALLIAINGDAVARAFLTDAQLRTDSGIDRHEDRFVAGVQYFRQKDYFSAEKAAQLLE